MSFQRKRQLAFTLMEVVAAMAVGAVGVFAFAGLQLKSVEITEESRERATAAYLASEMVERMSSNTQDELARQEYQGGASWSQTIDVNTLDSRDPCAGTTACDTPQALAQNDITTVKTMARGLLPNGDVNYKQCGATNNFDCIIVTWEDAEPDTCALRTDDSGLEDCFIMQVKLW